MDCSDVALAAQAGIPRKDKGEAAVETRKDKGEASVATNTKLVIDENDKEVSKFQQGDRIALKGLMRNANLNGLQGIVLAPHGGRRPRSPEPSRSA